MKKKTLCGILLSLFFLFSGADAVRADKAWMDVTAQYVQNPTFAGNSSAGWTTTGEFSKQDVQFECMEIYNGTFNVSQQLTGLPAGKYRLSVQAFFRTRENNNAYQSHQNHSENITAYLFAGDAQTKVHSVYDYEFSNNLSNNCWQTGNWWEGFRYFPNGMASGHDAFEQDLYWNTLEFEISDDNVAIGLKNATHMNQNWCLFDNFRLEYYGDVAPATANNLIINEVMAANVDMFWSLATCFHSWAELYNPTSEPVKLGGCYLSDNAANLRLWQIPDELGVVPAGGYAAVWFDDDRLSSLQAPFKLDVDGGTLYLSSPSGELLAQQQYPAAVARTSYARQTDGSDTWGTTWQPTPSATNNASPFATQQLDAPVVDTPSQVFRTSFAIHVDVPEGTTLSYTTNGSTPTLTNGTLATAPLDLNVTATTNYRFRLFADGFLPSQVVTRSYLRTQNNYTIPILSVVTDDDFLYGDRHGVMVQGTNGKPGRGQSQPCNWNMDWDRPVNFVYFDASGNELFQQEVSLSMCGGWSRAWSPHSFKLKGNKLYGTAKTLDYPFFAQKPYIRNRTLQIRNGGNDTGCRIKDAALETMILRSGVDIDAQAYQPVVHYINGKYIGVINMREPNNKHFVYANRGWDDDEIDLFEMDADSGYVQKCGTAESFNRLYELSKRVNEPGVYDEICQQLDIDEYINYMAATLYLGGNDWPQNNIKGYVRSEGGRFRFVSFDQDFAFSETDPFTTFFNKQTYTFAWLYDKQTSIRQEIRMVTLLKNLLGVDSFRRRFIDVFCIMGGSVFETTRARAIIDELATRVAAMMSYEGGSPWNTANEMKNKLGTWNTTVTNSMKRYSLFRLSSATAQTVRLRADQTDATLFVNDVEVPYADFNGRLFTPVRLRAEAPAGYQFTGWKDSNGQVVATDSEIDLPSGNVNLTASFEALPSSSAPVVINEVSAANDTYVNDYFKRGDWVELYNTTDADIDIAGMYLSDDTTKPHKYQIAAAPAPDGSTATPQAWQGTVIPAHGHLIVWCDKRDALAPSGGNGETTWLGGQLHAPFKLADDGGIVMISAADDSWSDVLSYESHNMDETVGRYPDGARNVYVSNVPTIGRRNVRTSYLVKVQQSPNAIRTMADEQQSFAVSYIADRLIVTTASQFTAAPATLIVHDAAGRTVVRLAVTLRAGRNELALPTLPRGYYVATVQAPGNGNGSCKMLLK